MSPPFTVALLGAWHVHAAGYASAVSATDSMHLAAVWDDGGDPDEAAHIAAASGAFLTDSLDAVMTDGKIDGVVVCTSTTAHAEVIGRALAAGKHVFTEKLLAPTVEECEALVETASSEGRTLAVSLPRLAEGPIRTALRLITDGALGEVTYTRVRMAHDGWVQNWLPERFADSSLALGGAFSDLGAHPAYLTQAFLGEAPKQIYAAYTRVSGRRVEDDAVVTAIYPSGAIGVAEASFVTTPGAAAFEVRGTRGTLLQGLGGEALLAKGDAFDTERWIELATDAPAPDPLMVWLDHARSRTQPRENQRAAVALTRFIATANRSAVAGRAMTY